MSTKKKTSFLASFLLILFLVGFSPQINIVYADSLVSGTYIPPQGTIEIGGSSIDFSSKDELSSIINIENSALEGLNADVLSSGFTDLSKLFSNLTSILRIIATSFSGVAIAVIGFKLMSSSNTNASQFLKGKKDLLNIALVIVFMFAIPFTVDAISEFKLPKFIGAGNGDEYYVTTSTTGGSTVRLDKLAIYPKSDIPDVIDTAIEKKIDAPKIYTKTDAEEEKEGSAIVNLVLDIITLILTTLIYFPLKFIVTLLGVVSLYPVGFDPAIYGEKRFGDMVSHYIFGKSGGTNNDTSKSWSIDSDMIKSLSGAMVKLTNTANFIYFFFKSITFLALDVVCYGYAIMVFVGAKTGSLGRFLKRLFTAVFATVLLPLVVQFLLDMDAIFSATLLRIVGGDGVPGLSLLSLIPSQSAVRESIVLLFLGFFLCVTILILSKTFFIRRIEITLYYMVGPLVCLGHIIPTSTAPLVRWFKNIVSAIFLPTVYTPVLMISTILISTANGGGEEQNIMGIIVYYVLIIAVLWFGKDMIDNILMLFGHDMFSSESSRRARSSIESVGVKELVSNATLGGKMLLGAAGGVTSTAKNVGNIGSNLGRLKGEAAAEGKGFFSHALSKTGNAIKDKAGDVRQSISKNASPFTNWKLGYAEGMGGQDVKNFVKNNPKAAIALAKSDKGKKGANNIISGAEAVKFLDKSNERYKNYKEVISSSETTSENIPVRNNNTMSYNGVDVSADKLPEIFEKKQSEFIQNRKNAVDKMKASQKKLKEHRENGNVSKIAEVEVALLSAQKEFEVADKELEKLFLEQSRTEKMDIIKGLIDSRNTLSHYNNISSGVSTTLSTLSSSNINNFIDNNGVISHKETNATIKAMFNNPEHYGTTTQILSNTYNVDEQSGNYVINSAGSDGNRDNSIFTANKAQAFNIAQNAAQHIISNVRQNSNFAGASIDNISDIINVSSDKISSINTEMHASNSEIKRIDKQISVNEVEKLQSIKKVEGAQNILVKNYSDITDSKDNFVFNYDEAVSTKGKIKDRYENIGRTLGKINESKSNDKNGNTNQTKPKNKK